MNNIEFVNEVKGQRVHNSKKVAMNYNHWFKTICSNNKNDTDKETPLEPEWYGGRRMDPKRRKI